MAAQTVSPPSTPSAQVIGNAFVEQYYHILHHSPELVFRFYQDTSLLSRPDPNGLMTTVTTMKSINDKICSLDYKNYKAEIKTADAQDSYKDGVIVLVSGCLTGKDNLRRKFTQTFFLAPQDKGYYVLNDVFRYVEENGSDTSAVVDIGVQETPSSSLEPNPGPAKVVDSPSTNHASSIVNEVEIIEGIVDDEVINEGQAVNDTDKLAEADPQVNENDVSVAVESLPCSPQEDGPKKSYASIVSSQTKKGPIKVYVPTNTAKVVSAKTEKQPVNTAEHPAPESSSPIAPDNASESRDTQDEVEGHSIYIRNLPLNVTASQLESEFQKFGAIKPNGVQVRSNKQQGFCFGFVEFQEFSSMQSAIKASPITIGDRQAAVEIKRTTTRVGGGRGRFTPSRGGYRNDSFRGRGNYNDGRTYVRSDSLRGRGNFSSGRSGDGYQQGRGRGGRRSSPTQNSAST
ncbi:nuclear transport factor 2-like isoform X2 [Salvia miltiorrhiza]|uniref:nuclear transport factor 2-like isoform X2 n=1 Tax=Salvia miltiorrhiza TaxID=226208 RepID=UPI0025ABC2A9|nr:nuclear transport factor 2-like isoform X2 [Salvia miltiorrhiza]XP_057769719.1 nuclear transport factor 2-like isoform X2 [Salvia miltiorrhiza]XP_057769720.1 nuclear transport factor 2-like isoform X2 [Salvia miltiorrhiza]XP_057769721.1 nuclear transport factor 2-like isoform X2 [Salvia miltiorrhiza]